MSEKTKELYELLEYYEDNLCNKILRKENEGTNQYTPISFIVKSMNEKNKEQFILGQEYKKVTYFEMINNSN